MKRLNQTLPLVALVSVLGAAPAPSDLDQRYQRARTEMQKLLADPVRSRQREPYEQLLRKLDDLVAANPAGPIADRAAFTAATLTEELSEASRVPSDLEAANERLRAFVERYPDSRLADDALLTAARIALERRSDQVHARALLSTLIERYPQGDMAAQARELLGRLPRVDGRARAEARSEDSASRPAATEAADERSDRIGVLLQKADLIVTGAGTHDDMAAAVRAADAKLRQLETGNSETSAAARPTVATPASGTTPAVVRDISQRTATSERPAHVKKLQLRTTEAGTSVLIEVDAAVSLVAGEALADAKKQLPHRVFYDLSPAKLERAARETKGSARDRVQRVRAAQNVQDTVRVVVELVDGANAAEPIPCAGGLCVAVTLPGDAPAIEVASSAPALATAVAATTATATATTQLATRETKPQPKVEPAAPLLVVAPPPAVVAAPTATAQPPVATSAPAEILPEMMPKKSSSAGLSLSQQVGLNVRTIVLDPGHGGSDPGAIGPTGLREKDVTLKVAKRIAEKLRKELDVNVILTRETDQDLSLEQRAAIANEAHADLFLSVHVNASPNRRAYGIETFYLNTTDDRYAIRLAARENAGSEKSIGDLQFILADLVTKSNVDDSRRLGSAVQANAVSQMSKRFGDIKDLGVKNALFFVLIGVKMPSILIESSFISNRREEGRLRQNPYLDAIADGVVRGVRSFIETQKAPGT